ncbi:NAD(P)/FAD-dependent oxidoreductase [Nocardia sp. NPDC004123]
MPLDHAVVLGGSIAGLLAAAALSDSFAVITIVERDELEDTPALRRGVPQGTQVHQLMSLGLDRIEQLLPDFAQDLLDNGCEQYDAASMLPFWTPEGWGARAVGGIGVIGFLRPTFEWLLRRRVFALSNVRVVKGVATSLISTDDRTRVTGVKVRGAEIDEISADLVVDATGRGSKSGNWLEDLGYDRPEEQHIRPFMGYATMVVRFPDGVLPDGMRGLGAPPHPGNTKGGSFQPCGDGNHVVAACGMARDYPPGELDALLDFLDQAPSPLLGAFARKAEVVTPPTTYQMIGSQRRLWEQLDRRPEGFVVVGDAVTSFNPLYGQGMTMAALAATILKDVVAESGGEIAGIAEKVSRDLAPWSDIAFGMAAGQDSFYAGTEFVNFEPPCEDTRQAQSLILQVATADTEVMLALRRAAYYMDPTVLQTESVQSKIKEWSNSGRTPSAAATDPNHIPDIVPFDVE